MDARTLAIFAVLGLGAGAAFARARPAAAASGQQPVADWLGPGLGSTDSAASPDNAWSLDLTGIDTTSAASIPFDERAGTNVVGDYPSDDNNHQLPSFAESFMNAPLNFIPRGASPTVAAANERAILDMIAWAEGTAGKGDDGYNVLFGGGLFTDYTDHPRRAFQFRDTTGALKWTTAAGRYQAMAVSPLPNGGTTHTNTWDVVQARLGLPDFGPDSQDRFALELIREKGALGDVRTGALTKAIAKISPVWASLPGANAKQPERQLNTLLAKFQAAGGTLEA